MNWQAVIDSLQTDVAQLGRSAMAMPIADKEKVLQMAATLKILADALQMGLNTGRTTDADPAGK